MNSVNIVEPAGRLYQMTTNAKFKQFRAILDSKRYSMRYARMWVLLIGIIICSKLFSNDKHDVCLFECSELNLRENDRLQA